MVVAIDPAVSTGEDADETGIIVAGKDANGHGYVLADQSGRYPPTEWVAEVNNGGDMVEATVRMVDPNVSYNKVHASRGKVITARQFLLAIKKGRAAPLAAMKPSSRIPIGCRRLMKHMDMIDRDMSAAEAVVGFTLKPVLHLDFAKRFWRPIGEYEAAENSPGYGRHLMLSFFAYGNDEPLVFNNLDRLFRNLWTACHLLSREMQDALTRPSAN